MSSPRNNRATWLTSLGSMLGPVIYALATETYYNRKGPHQPSIHWSFLFSSHTYSLEQSTTARHFRPFQSHNIQASVKNWTLQTSVLLLSRDVTRSRDSSLCQWLIVRHQPRIIIIIIIIRRRNSWNGLLWNGCFCCFVGGFFRFLLCL